MSPEHEPAAPPDEATLARVLDASHGPSGPRFFLAAASHRRARGPNPRRAAM